MPTRGNSTSADSVGHGAHACVVFDHDAERDEVVADFVEEGLERGERVACFANGGGPGEAFAAFEAAGVAYRDVLACGQLVIRESPMTASLDAEIDAALADGFSGYRVTGDMSWATEPSAGPERLDAVEARVEALCRGRLAAALCQYDRRRFGAERVDRLERLHPARVCTPAVSDDGWLRIGRPRRPGGAWLRVTGELDLASSPLFARELDTTLDTGEEDVHVDLARLRFIDLAAARVLHERARELEAAGRRLVLHHPPALARRLFALLDANASAATAGAA